MQDSICHPFIQRVAPAFFIMNSIDYWIKVHRKIKSWGWYRDSDTKAVFLHLLLSANHRETKWMGQVLKPGQLVIGRRTLSEATGISEQRVRTCLNRLKSTHELTIKSTNKFSLITIVNWSFYQGGINGATSKLTSKSPTSNQQSTTDKEVKNKRNIEVVISEIKKVWYENLKAYREDYPHLDYNLIFQTMLDWLERHPKKAKQYKKWDLFIRNWLSKERPNKFRFPQQEKNWKPSKSIDQIMDEVDRDG